MLWKFNTRKLIQDGIFRALDINDSHVVSIVADKVLFPNIKEEKIYVCLEECEKSGVRFDIIPRPSKVWSEDVVFDTLKVLPEKGVRKNTIYKTDQEERADSYVYVVTPENLTLMKPVKIVQRCIEAVLGSKGFVFIAFSGDYEEGVEEFKALLLEYENKYSGIKVKQFIEEPGEEELLCWISEEP